MSPSSSNNETRAVHGRSWAESIGASFASLALHASLIALLANHTAQNAEPYALPLPVDAAPLIAVFIFEPAAGAKAAGMQAFVPALDVTDAIVVPPPSVPAFDAVAADSVEVGREIATVEDAQEVKRLQGIYVKQISDRVSRILETRETWQGIFPGPCVVHVIQNETGRVLDVDTQDCERESALRQRLADAIKAASPLPLPPHGLALGTYLTVDVSSL